MPESRAENSRRLDPPGQLLVIALLGCLTAGIIEGPRHGWGSTPIVALFAIAVLAAIALVVFESRRREPLIDLRYFRSVPFSGAALIGVFALATLGGFLFLNTLYLQDVRGYSALRAGLLTIPMAAMLGVFSAVAGRLVARRGPRLSLVLSGGLIAVGAILLIGVSAHTAMWYLIVAYLVFGAGSGLVSAPITNTALSGMPRDQAGVAGAIASTFRQTGAALGVAVTGAIIAGSSAGFVQASHAAWAVARRLWRHGHPAEHGLHRRLGADDRRAKRGAPGHCYEPRSGRSPMSTRSARPPDAASRLWVALHECVTGQDRRAALRAAHDLGPDRRLRDPGLPVRRT